MTQHSEKFIKSDAYQHCLSLLRYSYANSDYSHRVDPETALSNLSEQEVIEVAQFQFETKIQSHLQDKSENFRQVLVQIYFNFLLRDSLNPVQALGTLSEDIYEGINYFRGRNCGFTIPQFQAIEKSAFRTEEGSIDWKNYYHLYIDSKKVSDLFVEAACRSAAEFNQGNINSGEARLCLQYYQRRVLPEHFISKPEWSNKNIWHSGSFLCFYEDLLTNNLMLNGQEVYEIVRNISNNHSADNYYHFRLLANTYHLGIRYDDVKTLSTEECSRFEMGGVGHLMQQKSWTFQEAYSHIEGLSLDEIAIYTDLENYGLTLESLKNSAFHQKHFWGSSGSSLLKLLVRSSLEFLLSPEFIRQNFSWPEKTLTNHHRKLIIIVSKIIDSDRKMPNFEKIMVWAATLNTRQAEKLVDCMEQIKYTLLYRGDQLAVIKQHEDAIPPKDQRYGRNPYPNHLAPLNQNIALRIEGNQISGRVISSIPLDYENLNPIQCFILACASRYDLTYDLIENLSDIDACEYACAFLGYRVELPGKRFTILPGMSYKETLTKMQDSHFNMHEKRILGQLSPYGLEEKDMLESPLHTSQKTATDQGSAKNNFSFKRAQQVITLFNRKFANIESHPDPKEILSEVETEYRI